MNDKNIRLLYHRACDTARKMALENDPKIREDLCQELMSDIMTYHRMTMDSVDFIKRFNIHASRIEEVK